MKPTFRSAEFTLEQLSAMERDSCSYGDTVHYAENPPVFARCEGSFLYDSDDRPFLDLQMWNSAVNLGYRNARINDAVRKQLDTLPQLGSQYLHPSRIELAHRIAASVESSFGLRGRVQFSVGGAQAVEESLKLVRRHTGRSRMLAFEGGYHGRSLGALSITSSFRYREEFGDFPHRAELIPFPDCFRCPYGQAPADCGLFCAQQIERKFEQEQSGICDPKTGRSEIGALYIEPVQGTGGYIAPPGGYFVRLARLCRDFGILIVADEIQMGFFRTGRMWSAEHLGIEPDIIVFGKSLTNGLNPLSGLWAREDLLHPGVWPPGTTHSTFAANPMGTAAGVEVMKILTQQDYATSVCAKGAYLVGELQVLQRKHKALGFVHGIGLAVRLEICAPDGRTPDPQLADRLFQLGLTGELEARGRRYGLILGVGGPCKSTLTLAPSLNISEGEIDLAIELLDRSLEELGG